jgi:hypothetical protein
MGTPTNPQVGDREFNGSEFTYIVDLKPPDMQGMMTAQPGLAEVLLEVDGNILEWAEKAGLTAADVAELALVNERIARIDVFYPPVAKFAEMLIETRYSLEDRRQRILLNLGASVERRGKTEPELLAKYQKTRAYRSAIAKKGARTRRRNAAEAQQPAPVPAPAPAPAPVPAPAPINE